MNNQDPPLSPSRYDNNQALKNFSLETIKNIVAQLSADEKAMIGRGTWPSEVLEKLQGFKKTEVLPRLWEFIDRRLIISESDGIQAVIHNGADGCIKIKRLYSNESGAQRESLYKVMRFNGYIGPILRINQNTPGIKFTTPWNEVKLSVSDFLLHARSVYSLSVSQVQNLKLILDALVSEEYENGNI